MKTKKTKKTKHISRITPVKHAKTVLRVTPKFVHGMVVGAVLGVLVVGSLRYATSAYAATSGPSACVVSPIVFSNGVGQLNSFIINGDTATTTLKVAGEAGCTATMTLASWQAPYGSSNFHPYAEQKLLYTKTETFTPGQYTMSVQLADCDYQVDLVRGTAATATDGTPNYAGGQLLDFIQAGNKVCEPPVVVPPAPTTPTPTTPAPTPITTAATPTTLVNTGPGAIIIIGVLAAVSGYIFHMTHRHVKQRRHATHHA